MLCSHSRIRLKNLPERKKKGIVLAFKNTHFRRFNILFGKLADQIKYSMKKNVVSALLVMACFAGFAQDSKNKPFVASGKKIKVFTTAENTSLRLSPTSGSEFRPAKQPLENEVSVFVNPDKQFQTFMGIGGAITDASAEVFAKLSKQQQKEFLDAYYSREKGIGYSLIRTTIHSSDFSSESYTYVNENDKELNLEARNILLNSEISGGSYEYGSQYRDRVEKKNGAEKFERYYHTKLDSEWPEVLGIIGAYNLNQGDTKYCGNDVQITLLEKSEAEKYFFSICDGDGGFVILIDKKLDKVEFFSEDDDGYESINAILEGIENGDIMQKREPEKWFGNVELIDNLIGEMDNCFELSKTF